ncbi:MAG: tetratricopeptide repeat protein [Devosia sp.]
MSWVQNRIRALLCALAVLPLALVLLAGPASADESKDKAALDALFAELRLAPDAQAARAIDQRIWIYWTTPSDPELAGRMGEALAARRLGDIPGAIVLLTRLIEDYPTYAEAWNQRATMFYLINDFEASLADIEKVLEYEPRHFGALSGRALIYLQQGKRALALKDMAAALELHPFLNERQLFPELLQDITRI